MEKERCFVINVSAGTYPNSRDIDTIEEIEEERRVLYVALTRAKNELIITRILKANFAYDSSDSGKLMEMYFLNELPNELAKIVSHKKVDDLPPAFKTGKPLNINVGIDFS